MLEDITVAFSDLFKGSFPYYLFFILQIFMMLSPVRSSHEFPVYRMQHFDLHGVPHGCRTAGINLEARSLYSWSTNRHCVVARLQDLSLSKFRAICARAGALTIVLPRDLIHVSREIVQLESDMLRQGAQIPIYLMPWSPQLESIVDELESDGSGSSEQGQLQQTAWQALVQGVTASGYQMVVLGSQPQPRTDVQIANVHGRLLGHGPEEILPSLFIVSSYDAFGIAPDLAHGSDSNGSGVAVLLELARIFSSLYSNPRTHARFNIYFLIAGAGKFNFLGSKKYLEEQIDQLDSVNRQSSFVVCLDSLSRNNTLHIHVSRPPKEESLGAKFIQLAQKIDSSISMVHKKINLADEMLAWEHERFSIRKMQAFTLSGLWSHKDLTRQTIFDRKESIDTQALAKNAAIIAEALAELIYGVEGIKVLAGELKVEQAALEATMGWLSGQPRAQQLISEKGPLIASIRDLLARYVKEVRVSTLIPDRRDPDISFFDHTQAVLHVHNVKPAVFDLFLTLVIAVYLSLVYVFLTNFSHLYNLSIKLVSVKKKIY